jgi:PadR family transcriptional regulator, regulatory protein AphA
MRQTDYVILGLLSESPLTGYQIKKIIDGRFRFFWNESYGQLYPALKSLLSNGLIEESGLAVRTGRSPKQYQLTEHGLAELKQWLHLPVERESIRLEILLKMYFSHLVDEAVMIRHIQIFQQSHAHDLMILELFEKELKAIPEQDPNHGHVLRVIDFGKKVNEAYLNWSRETLLFFEGRTKK